MPKSAKASQREPPPISQDQDTEIDDSFYHKNQSEEQQEQKQEQLNMENYFEEEHGERILDSEPKQESKGGRKENEPSGILYEVPSDFSFFFGSMYSVELTTDDVLRWPVVYFVFSIRNDTLLHEEYAHFYDAKFVADSYFLSISSSLA